MQATSSHINGTGVVRQWRRGRRRGRRRTARQWLPHPAALERRRRGSPFGVLWLRHVADAPISLAIGINMYHEHGSPVRGMHSLMAMAVGSIARHQNTCNVTVQSLVCVDMLTRS